MAFPLPADFHTLFRREPYREPTLTSRGAIGRAVLIVFGTMIGAALLLLLPSRPFFRPHTQVQEAIEFATGVGMAVLVGGYYLYTTVWRPWRDGPPGYRLVGEFEVREKNHLFSKCWVRLAPGNKYQVEVEPDVYAQLQTGSRVRLLYTAGGELVSLTRLV
jgi:hypothetical protein